MLLPGFESSTNNFLNSANKYQLSYLIHPSEYTLLLIHLVIHSAITSSIGYCYVTQFFILNMSILKLIAKYYYLNFFIKKYGYFKQSYRYFIKYS